MGSLCEGRAGKAGAGALAQAVHVCGIYVDHLGLSRECLESWDPRTKDLDLNPELSQIVPTALSVKVSVCDQGRELC